jgi:glycosyltransferase involved in cell wall biosynthesis
MASGVPCLVTDVGDSADVVGPTGVVVAPDDVDALVEGLQRLLAMDAPERARRGREGRERVVSRHSPAAARASYRGLWAAADR